jgi:nitrogen fixation NifU-like protein
MPDLRDLYQDLIINHSKNPRNFRKLERVNRQAEGLNPLCGDNFSVYIQIENGFIEDIGFMGTGCAIATAAASMMTEHLKGKTESEVKVIFEQFHQLLTGPAESLPDSCVLGTLQVFSGVRGYPVRIKCAILAWQTMYSALMGYQGTVSTEKHSKNQS